MEVAAGYTCTADNQSTLPICHHIQPLSQISGLKAQICYPNYSDFVLIEGSDCVYYINSKVITISKDSDFKSDCKIILFLSQPYIIVPLQLILNWMVLIIVFDPKFWRFILPVEGKKSTLLGEKLTQKKIIQLIINGNPNMP